MKVGLIGGTCFADLEGESRPLGDAETPYGPASARVRAFERWPKVLFLNRHGGDGGSRFLPHEVNYRANLWLLRERGAGAVLAVYAVGGIAPELKVGDLVIPDQLIDYTWGRAHTVATGAQPRYVDFRDPFDNRARTAMLCAAADADVTVSAGGVYGCTQGPRLETAAEIDRMERDGCAVVGMTAMPEAALAREFDLPLAGVCLVVNPAAGRGPPGPTVQQVDAVVADAEPRLAALLRASIDILAAPASCPQEGDARAPGHSRG